MAAGTLTYLIFLGKGAAIALLLIIALGLLVRNYLSYKKKIHSGSGCDEVEKSESKTVQGIISESADNIVSVIHRSNKIYSDVFRGLAKQDKAQLKKSKKGVAKLDAEIEELRDSIFFFIKSLDETSVRGSSFYITVLAYLTDIAQSLEFISKKSYKHVNNNHKPLRYNQITDLREIDDLLENFLKEIEEIFANRKLDQIQKIVEHKEEVLAKLSEKN